MDTGTRVQINWNSSIGQHKSIEAIVPLGDSVLEVVHYDGVGIYHLLLPTGVTAPGYSMPWGNNRHFIILHQSHLRVLAPTCTCCGESGGRHKGGCALAPKMYKTPEGIPVRRTPRKYHGDFDG